jgi:hypothetical protein
MRVSIRLPLLGARTRATHHAGTLLWSHVPHMRLPMPVCIVGVRDGKFALWGAPA